MDFKHQRYGTSEYAFLIQELPSLQGLHRGEDLKVVYAEAIQAYKNARTASLRLVFVVRDCANASINSPSVVSLPATSKYPVKNWWNWSKTCSLGHPVAIAGHFRTAYRRVRRRRLVPG